MTSEKEQKILTEARDRLKKAITDDDENRRLAYNDLEFIAIEGKQWPDAIRVEREANNQPCLTINKLPAFVDQVVGDQRMNRPSIRVVPVDSYADKKVARILSGWIKHVQNISKADIAVDHGFEHAVTCGYGAIRVVTKFLSDTSVDQQEAFIEKVENALAVYWGKHKEYDCSDAKYCFIVSDIDREEFEDKYKVPPMPFNYTDSQYVEGWCTNETVRVVEYFVKEPTERMIYLLSDGRTVDKVETTDIVVKKRNVKSHKIMWYLLSGNKVLDSKEWAGKKYIPVIPIWGKELNVGGKKVIRGLIRNGKDAQRMYNYWQALDLNTPIPIPGGWTTMKDVVVGSQLFDEAGKVCEVTNISPVFLNRNCAEVLFDDGSVITADVKHLWTVEERGKRTSRSYSWTKRTITTDQLIPGKHFIYVADPLDLPAQELPIDPYVLGVWLGDGSVRDVVITQSKDDWSELSQHLSKCGCQFGTSTIKDNCVATTLLGMRSKFSELSLLDNKHIPYLYVRSSKEQRLQLLQGLMDTDGSVNTVNGQCSFTTTSAEIAKGFSELIRTLGIKSSFLVRNRNGANVFDNAKLQYQFSFTTRLNVFKLSRKLKGIGNVKEEVRRTKRYKIKSVTPVLSVPVKCVTVDSASCLYLAGVGMVPTHNSCDTEVVALQPKTPYLITPKQIKGHEAQWKDAHRRNFPYLLVNFDEKAPGWPKRESPPQASSAMVEKIQMADQEMRDTMGLQKASLGMQSNERSGSAIRERKLEGDVGTFAFIDNLSRSIQQVGRILVDIAPVILDTQRIVRLGLEDGDFEFEEVNVQDKENPQQIMNDLSIGTYDVTVTVGPSFTTQRTEARQSMQEFIQYNPNAAPLIGDLYAKLMDWPGADEVSKRLEYLLPPEIRTEIITKRALKEGKEPPPQPGSESQQPDPTMVLKIQTEQVKLQEAQIKLQQEQAKLEEIKLRQQLAIAESRQRVSDMVEKLIAEKLGEREKENAERD